MDEYEETLASRRVIRVLGIVAECEEITITDFTRKAGLDHMAADRIVKRLSSSLLCEEYHGRNRFLRPNFKNYIIFFHKEPRSRTTTYTSLIQMIFLLSMEDS